MAEEKDARTSREQLFEELLKLRQRVAELENLEHQRALAHKALRESAAQSRALFDRIADPIFIFDQETKRFLDCNQAAIARYGYTLDELQTMTPRDLHPPDELEMVERNIEDRETISPNRYTHVAKDGKSLQVEIHTDEIEYDGRSAWISIVRDITERQQIEEALAHERDLLQTLMDNTPDYIFFKDRESRFVRTNWAHAQLLGLADPQKAIGKTDFDFFDQEDAQRFYAEEQRIMESGQPVVAREWPISGIEGETSWVSEHKIPITDETGRVIGLVGIARDITEHKQMDQALREAHDELTQHAATLERRTAQLQAASEVARDATAIRDVQQLLDETVDLCTARFGFYHTSIFLLDERNEYAVLRASSSPDGRRMVEQGYRMRIGEVGIVGHVAATGEPRIALDVDEDAVFFDHPDLPDTRSEMALPLKVRGRTTGVLDVQSTETAAFAEEDVTALQTMADQLAVAIENARLAERTEAQLRQLRRLYGEYSSAAWAELASQERSVGYVYDRIDVVPAEKAPGSGLDLVLERAETVPSAETQTRETVLAMPLKLRDQVIGALGVQDTEGLREWSPHEIALVEAVSEQVALALENARLFEEARRRLQEQAMLFNVSQRLAGAPLRADDIASIVARQFVEVMGVPECSISLLDPQRETLHVVTDLYAEAPGEGILRDEHGDVYRLADYPATAQAIETLQPLVVQASDPDADPAELAYMQEYGTVTLAIIPLVVKGEAIGIVELEAWDREIHYSEAQLNLATTLANQAAVALENARLFEETRTYVEELAVLNELGRTLTAHLDVEEVLDAAYVGASRLLDTTDFYIAFYDPESDSISFPLAVEDGQRTQWRSRHVGPGLTEYIVRNRQPLLIRDNLPERLEEMGIELIGRAALCWLGVPLTVGDQVLGVMAVQSHTTPRAYDDHDRDLLLAIASQTAIALQNARLFEQAQRRARRERLIREVTAKVVGSTDVDAILRTTAQELGKALGTSHAVVRLGADQGSDDSGG